RGRVFVGRKTLFSDADNSARFNEGSRVAGWRGIVAHEPVVRMAPEIRDVRQGSGGASKSILRTSSSHRRPRAMALTRRARCSNCSGRTSLRDRRTILSIPEAKEARAIPLGAGDSEGDLAVIGLAAPGKAI